VAGLQGGRRREGDEGQESDGELHVGG
jgi:hypothetical protein